MIQAIKYCPSGENSRGESHWEAKWTDHDRITIEKNLSEYDYLFGKDDALGLSVAVAGKWFAVNTPNRKRKKPATDTRTHIRYWGVGADDGKHYYTVWWTGYCTPSIESEDTFVGLDWPSYLAKIREKGHKAKRTELTGHRSFLESTVSVSSGQSYTSVYSLGTEQEGSPRPSPLPHIKVRYRSDQGGCVLWSFLNLVDLGKKKRRKMIAKMGGAFRNDIREMASVVGIARCSLRICDHTSIENWLMEHKTGLFLIGNSHHCVGVDFQRRLVFCSSEIYALPLSIRTLTHCNVLPATFLREIIQ